MDIILKLIIIIICLSIKLGSEHKSCVKLLLIMKEKNLCKDVFFSAILFYTNDLKEGT